MPSWERTRWMGAAVLVSPPRQRLRPPRVERPLACSLERQQFVKISWATEVIRREQQAFWVAVNLRTATVRRDAIYCRGADGEVVKEWTQRALSIGFPRDASVETGETSLYATGCLRTKPPARTCSASTSFVLSEGHGLCLRGSSVRRRAEGHPCFSAAGVRRRWRRRVENAM